MSFDFVVSERFTGSEIKLFILARHIVKECAPYSEYGGALDSESEKAATEHAALMIVLYGYDAARLACLETAKNG